MLLLLLLACLPVPSPDLRRPAALIVLDGEGGDGAVIKACTWSTHHSPLEGCENLDDGVPAVDGIGVREWSTFPLILRGRSPAWADAFVACKDGRSLGATFRLPGFAPAWDETVHLTLGQTTRRGVSSLADIDDATARQLQDGLCAGSIPLKAD